MSREIKEWSAIGVLVSISLVLFVNASDLNKKSFGEVARIIYGVNTEVGNLRERPSVDSEVLVQMKSGDRLRLKNSLRPLLKVKGANDHFKPIKRGEWYKIKHLASSAEGWAHKSIIGKYLYLGYYDDYVIDKSVLEIVWD